MAPGIYGADIEQLRTLSKTMGLSGSSLLNTERQISSLVSSTAWKGNDGGQFRREWSGTLRPMLNKASLSLIDASKMLLTQADEQQNARACLGLTTPLVRHSNRPAWQLCCNVGS